MKKITLFLILFLVTLSSATWIEVRITNNEKDCTGIVTWEFQTNCDGPYSLISYQEDNKLTLPSGQTETRWNGERCVNIASIPATTTSTSGTTTTISTTTLLSERECESDSDCQEKYYGTYASASLMKCNFATGQCIWCVDGSCNDEDCQDSGGCIVVDEPHRCHCKSAY